MHRVLAVKKLYTMQAKNKPSADAKQAKKIFDLCQSIGDGVYGKLHLIYSLDDNRLPEDETKAEYRGYHGDGYCFTVSKEKAYLAEDESNSDVIDGYEYLYSGDQFEGFKELSLLDCKTMLLNV